MFHNLAIHKIDIGYTVVASGNKNLYYEGISLKEAMVKLVDLLCNPRAINNMKKSVRYRLTGAIAVINTKTQEMTFTYLVHPQDKKYYVKVREKLLFYILQNLKERIYNESNHN